MLIRLVLLACFLTLTLAANAAVDSINVENFNGKKTIVHKVEAKETYYSIARKYSVAPQSVIQFNSNRPLQIGMVIKVPTERDYAAAGLPAPADRPQSGAQMAVVEYKVGPREYLLSIARKFNTTVEDIKALNNLTGNNLAVGQILKIPYGTANEQLSTPPAQPLNTPPAADGGAPTVIDSSMNASDRLRLPPSRYGLSEVTERGVAVWISDENIDATKMLALHPTAPIGTIIKVTNPMTGKSTFTKVVGKFTQSEATRDATIVVTKAVADLLGVLDRRFQATLVYGIPNE